MRPYLLVAFGAAFLFQLVALPLYQLPLESLGLVGPDFVLLLVIYTAVFDRPRRGLQAAVVAASLSEVLSVEPWGAYALPYLTAAWVCSRFVRRGWGDDVPARFIVILLAVAAALAARGVLLRVFGSSDLSPGLDAALVMILYNGILGVFIFSLLDPIRGQLVAPPRLGRLQ